MTKKIAQTIPANPAAVPANSPTMIDDVKNATAAVATENPAVGTISTTNVALAGLSSHRLNSMVELCPRSGRKGSRAGRDRRRPRRSSLGPGR